MHIICPKCLAAYEVDGLLIAGGRKLRCSKCVHEWLVTGEEPPTAGPMQPEPEAARHRAAADDRLAPRLAVSQMPQPTGPLLSKPAQQNAPRMARRMLWAALSASSLLALVSFAAAILALGRLELLTPLKEFEPNVAAQTGGPDPSPFARPGSTGSQLAVAPAASLPDAQPSPDRPLDQAAEVSDDLMPQGTLTVSPQDAPPPLAVAPPLLSAEVAGPIATMPLNGISFPSSIAGPEEPGPIADGVPISPSLPVTPKTETLSSPGPPPDVTDRSWNAAALHTAWVASRLLVPPADAGPLDLPGSLPAAPMQPRPAPPIDTATSPARLVEDAGSGIQEPPAVVETFDPPISLPAVPAPLPHSPLPPTDIAASPAEPVTDASRQAPDSAEPMLQLQPSPTAAQVPASAAADAMESPFGSKGVTLMVPQAIETSGSTLPSEVTVGTGPSNTRPTIRASPFGTLSRSREPETLPQGPSSTSAPMVAQAGRTPAATPEVVGPAEGGSSMLGAPLAALGSPNSALPETATLSLAKPPLSGESPQTATTNAVSARVEMRTVLEQRGQALFALGDVASARLFFRRAAEGGSATAAAALGKSYDPDILAGIGALGLQADGAMAAEWYRRAVVLGDREAEELLAKLKPSGG